MAQVLQKPVVERKSRKKYLELYASICSRTWRRACSPLPSCQVRVARQGRKRHAKCLAEDDQHKSLSHIAREFHSGPRSNRACRKGGCNCDKKDHEHIQHSASSIQHTSGSERGEGDSPEKSQNFCLWAGLPWFALKTDKMYAPTALSTASRLPFLDVRPCALVHGVVDGYDNLHVWSPRIVVLTRHRRVELCFRRVYPFCIVAAGNGRELAGGGE